MRAIERRAATGFIPISSAAGTNHARQLQTDGGPIEMKINRRIIAAGAAVLVVAAGGVGIAYRVGGGDSDEQATGPDAEKAKAAAVEAVGGGTAVSVERGDDRNSAFEVEVKRDDGSQVEVQVDAGGQAGGTSPDDDSGGESDDDAGGDDD